MPEGSFSLGAAQLILKCARLLKINTVKTVINTCVCVCVCWTGEAGGGGGGGKK